MEVELEANHFFLKKQLITETATTISTTEGRAGATCEIPDEDYLHWEFENMTAITKSREDPNGLTGTQMPSITTPKNITRIGCWNVRTMFQIGKTVNIIREFNRYKLDIMGLSEVRWT